VERGDLSHLQRKIYVDSGLAQGYFDDGIPSRNFHRRYGDPNKVLADWAEAFEGDLVFDGVLCYKDRALVRPAFCPGSWQQGFKEMYYRKDVDIWWWAKAHQKNVGGEVGEHAQKIAKAYAEAGMDGVSEILGRVASRADEEAFEEFKNLYCKARPRPPAPQRVWLEIP
jgi:hypothetical protein